MCPRTILEDDGDAARMGRPDAGVDRSIGEDFHRLRGAAARSSLLSHGTPQPPARDKDHPPTGSKADRRVVCTRSEVAVPMARSSRSRIWTSGGLRGAGHHGVLCLQLAKLLARVSTRTAIAFS